MAKMINNKFIIFKNILMIPSKYWCDFYNYYVNIKKTYKEISVIIIQMNKTSYRIVNLLTAASYGANNLYEACKIAKTL